MSIRDIQLDGLVQMEIDIKVAGFLVKMHEFNVDYAMRCRAAILDAIDRGCDVLAESYNATVQCCDRTVYWKISFFSELMPNLDCLIYLFNAQHPDCSFARRQIEEQKWDEAYQLLEAYVNWVDNFHDFVEIARKSSK